MRNSPPPTCRALWEGRVCVGGGGRRGPASVAVLRVNPFRHRFLLLRRTAPTISRWRPRRALLRLSRDSIQ